MQVREKVGKSRNTVSFQWFEAPEGRKVGSLKRRVRSHLARWEMKNCTPLWREAHFEVKMYKAHHAQTTFGSWDVDKVHAVVARSTFPSQIVQNTPASDHFYCRMQICVGGPPPQTNFGNRLVWKKQGAGYAIVWNQKTLIDFNWFQSTSNLLWIDFKLFSIYFKILWIDFNLLWIDFNLLWIDFNWFQFTLNWFQFTFNWFQLISTDFNLLSNYFQLMSIYFHWFQFVSIDFNCFQFTLNWFQSSLNWFQLTLSWFQFTLNWFQFTLNWFQFTFNWFQFTLNWFQ